MKKLALFFGAGAEISYGLPSGGKFALDIFRENTTKDKEEIKEQLRNVDTRSNYALWLPKDFENKKLTAFAKTQYDSLVKGSLENKRHMIIEYMKSFDKNIAWIVNDIKRKSNIDIDEIFEEITESAVGEINYSQQIRLNKILGDDLDTIFETDYFSVLLSLIQCENTTKVFKKDMIKIIRNILELLIGSLGEELTHRLNDGIFEKSPDIMDLFDDLGSIFSLDYSNTGLRGLELLIENEIKDLSEIPSENKEEILLNFGMMILEDIFSRALDYQTLIDTNWRYIYNPSTDWGKFSKISIFLYTVRRYITSIAQNKTDSISNGDGYYHDVSRIKDRFEILGIGTSNYNTFIKDITKEDVLFLNGSVDDYYDPYLNKIVTKEDNENKKHIIVPFLFTQSGIKPLTSVKMSERYVNLFNKFKDADIMCVCGFSFNSDDGHINGMFRELIEDHSKEITILHYSNIANVDKREIQNDYKKKLRLTSIKRLNIIVIDNERKDVDTGKYWYESLVQA